MKFLIKWGVAAGYGGISSAAVIEADDLDAAMKEAYDRSKDEVDMYGLGDDAVTEAIENGELDSDDSDSAGDVYREEIDRWVDYKVEEWTGSPEQVAELEGYGGRDETLD